MTLQQIADRLVALCRQGAYEQAQDELYHADAISLEPSYSPTPEVKGLAGIKEKGKQFNAMIKEYHGGYVSDPLVAGNHITLTMGMDITPVEGPRENMEEVCVYEVRDGKIVKEQFFF